MVCRGRAVIRVSNPYIVEVIHITYIILIIIRYINPFFTCEQGVVEVERLQIRKLRQLHGDRT